MKPVSVGREEDAMGQKAAIVGSRTNIPLSPTKLHHPSTPPPPPPHSHFHKITQPRGTPP